VYFKDKQDLNLAIAGRALEMLRQRFTEATDRARTGMDKVEA
jgi:AcrR family transcriptional regulator